MTAHADLDMGRAIVGERGKPGTYQRLCWVLLGCPLWWRRAVCRELDLAASPDNVPDIAREIRRRGHVRLALRCYLYELDDSMQRGERGAVYHRREHFRRERAARLRRAAERQAMGAHP